MSFHAAKTLCDLRVASVASALSGEPVKYGTSTALLTDSYHVE